MSEERNDPLDSLLSMLKQQRDELKLQMHLAGKEARDQFEDLEKKWTEIESRAEPLSAAVKDASSAAGGQARKVTAAAMDVAAREISSGYEKLRKLLD
jgi:hypothetical protein